MSRHARPKSVPERKSYPKIYVCSPHFGKLFGEAAAARETAKKLGVEIKETYVTTGESDLLSIVESASGDNVAKFCMAIGSQGNVRTRTVRAWPQADYAKLISELP